MYTWFVAQLGKRVKRRSVSTNSADTYLLSQSKRCGKNALTNDGAILNILRMSLNV